MNEQIKAIIDRARALLAKADWYAYDPENGTEWHGTQADAKADALAALDNFRDASPDGWHEDVGSVQWGVLIPFEQVEEIDRVETPGAEFDYLCDYAMKPHELGGAVMAVIDGAATLCDALKHAERRAEDAEAQAGAVRNAMDDRGGIHTYYVGDHGWGSYEKCPVCEDVADALATDAGRALLDRLHAAEAECVALRDRAGIAEGREAAAKANAEQMAGWLDARNAGLVQMARERDALREKLAAVEAKVARMVARVCAGCHGCGLAHLDGGSPRCAACGGNGAVIVDGVTVAHALTVAEVQRESYDTARAKGWHEEDDQPPSEAMMRIAAEGLYQSARCRFIEAYRRGERGVDALAGVDPMGTMATLSDRQVRVIAWMALVNTEVAEAIEDVVAGRWGTTKNEKGKPDGLGSELADIVIRVCDSAGALGIDMEAELRAKLAFNRTRSHKHGGKLA